MQAEQQNQVIPEFSRSEMLQRDDGVIDLVLIGGAIANKLRTSRVARGLTALGAIGLTGLLLGGFDNVTNRFHEEKTITATTPEAEYKGSFVYTSPNMCFGGYTSQVKPQAELADKITGDIPLVGTKEFTPFWANAKLDFGVTNVTCVPSKELTGVWSKDNKRITVTLDGASINSYAFKSDPLNNFKAEKNHNLLATPLYSLDTVLNGLKSAPLIGDAAGNIQSMTGVERVENTLQNFAETSGYYQATKSCGALALKDAGAEGGPWEKAIATGIAELKGIDVKNVDIVMPKPSDFVLEDQYTGVYNKILQSQEVKDGKITLKFDTALHCKASADHNKVIVISPSQMVPGGSA